MNWSWVGSNAAAIWQYTRQTAFWVSCPHCSGWPSRCRWGSPPRAGDGSPPRALAVVNVIYAIPALALFIVLIPAFGLTSATLIIALTVYSLGVILPNVTGGLRSAPGHVHEAATAMGYGPLRQLVQVELPLASPVIIAGLRVAVVSSISLASVGQLIRVTSLGYLFIDGLQRSFPTEIYVGLVLVILLALGSDLGPVLTRRVLTPWLAVQRAPRHTGRARMAAVVGR